MQAAKDIILTGLPRSGTTLACLLLSKIPQFVALNEPMRAAGFRSRSEALRAIPEFYAATRRSILDRGVAMARAVDGKMTDNHFAQVKGERVKLVSKEEIAIDKPLSEDFRLACKHNTLFTALQDDLRGEYPFFAIVRNPLATLASWNTLDMPASRGKLTALDHLLPEEGKRLKRAGDLFDRQLFILNWFFTKYAELSENQIIKYEEVVGSNGAALSVIDAGAVDLVEDLSSRNRSKVYDWDKIGPLADRLLDSTNACWEFYDRSEVEALLVNR